MRAGSRSSPTSKACATPISTAPPIRRRRHIVLNAKMRRARSAARPDRWSTGRSPRMFCRRFRRSACRRCELAAIRKPCAGSTRGARDRAGLADRVSRRSWAVVDGVAAAVDTSPLRVAPHRCDRDRGQATAERFLRESTAIAGQRLDSVRRWRRVRYGRRDRHPTQRLPPRGPVGAAELTTCRYLVCGNGQVRP